MQKSIIILLFTLFSFQVYSQTPYLRAVSAPKKFKTVQSLAKYLVEPFDREDDKFMALAYWVSFHIKYDVRMLKSKNANTQDTKKTLKRRKGLCANYADLLYELCDYAEIECYVVTGTTRRHDDFSTDTLVLPDHAWNVSRIYGTWYHTDATYAYGGLAPKRQLFRKLVFKIFRIPYRIKYKSVKYHDPYYIKMSNDSLLYSHYPDVPMWHLKKTPLPVTKFMSGHDSIKEFYQINKKGSFSYLDTINKYMTYNEPSFYIECGNQALRHNPNNHSLLAYGYSRAALCFWENLNPINIEKSIESLDSMGVLFKRSNENYSITKKEFSKFNKLKVGNRKPIHKKLVKDYSLQKKKNNKLIKSYKKYIKVEKRSKKSSRKNIKKTNSYKKSLSKNEANFYKIKRKPSEKKDSIVTEIMTLFDSSLVVLKQNQETIEKKKDTINMFHDLNRNQFNMFSSNISKEDNYGFYGTFLMVNEKNYCNYNCWYDTLSIHKDTTLEYSDTLILYYQTKTKEYEKSIVNEMKNFKRNLNSSLKHLQKAYKSTTKPDSCLIELQKLVNIGNNEYDILYSFFEEEMLFHNEYRNSTRKAVKKKLRKRKRKYKKLLKREFKSQKFILYMYAAEKAYWDKRININREFIKKNRKAIKRYKSKLIRKLKKKEKLSKKKG